MSQKVHAPASRWIEEVETWKQHDPSWSQVSVQLSSLSGLRGTLTFGDFSDKTEDVQTRISRSPYPPTCSEECSHTAHSHQLHEDCSHHARRFTGPPLLEGMPRSRKAQRGPEGTRSGDIPFRQGPKGNNCHRRSRVASQQGSGRDSEHWVGGSWRGTL
jgi:hypothetical protein